MTTIATKTVKAAASAATAAADELTKAQQRHERAAVELAECESAVNILLKKAGQSGDVTPTQLAEARAAVELADIRVSATAKDLENIKREADRFRRAELTAVFAADPLLNGEAEFEAYQRYELAVKTARDELARLVNEMFARQAEAAAEAESAGFTRASTNASASDRLWYVPRGEPVAYFEGKGIALPGRPYWKTTAGGAIRAVEDGKMLSENVPIATPHIDAADGNAVDGDYVRSLMSKAYGVNVYHLSQWDTEDTASGLWVRVDDAGASDGAVTFTATGFARGANFGTDMRPGDGPWHNNGVIVTAFRVRSVMDIGGYTVTATIIDPSATDSDDVAIVTQAVLDTINAVSTEAWGFSLQWELEGSLRIGASAKAEGRTVTVSFIANRNNSAAYPLALTPTVLRDVLDGLPVPGWGVVSALAIINDGESIALTFSSGGADANGAAE